MANNNAWELLERFWGGSESFGMIRYCSVIVVFMINPVMSRFMNKACSTKYVIWTYGLQLWGTAKKSFSNIIQCAQNKILKQILNAPRCTFSWIILQDTDYLKIEEQIAVVASKYKTRIDVHLKELTSRVHLKGQFTRLKRKHKISSSPVKPKYYCFVIFDVFLFLISFICVISLICVIYT